MRAPGSVRLFGLVLVAEGGQFFAKILGDVVLGVVHLRRLQAESVRNLGPRAPLDDAEPEGLPTLGPNAPLHAADSLAKPRHVLRPGCAELIRQTVDARLSVAATAKASLRQPVGLYAASF